VAGTAYTALRSVSAAPYAGVMFLAISVNKPASTALFYSVLVSTGFLFGFFTSQWTFGPKVNEQEVKDRYIFLNDYGEITERLLAVESKVKMLSVITQGEPADGFLEFALEDFSQVISDLEDLSQKTQNEDFREYVNDDIEQAKKLYARTKHNK
jgi:hypothetical protein